MDTIVASRLPALKHQGITTLQGLTAAEPLLYTLHVHKRQIVKNVKVTELRQNLPTYLARVRRGERLRITSRGKVIAEIAPPVATKEEIAAARKLLRGSLLRYDNPTDPAIDPSEWEVNR